MIRWFLLILTLSVMAAASFTVLKPPTLFLWKVAILVGEYGYLLVVVPLLLIWVAWFHGQRLAAPILFLSLLAIGLLLRPVVQAAFMGEKLPAQLTRAFGKAELKRAPFSWATLTQIVPDQVEVETMEFSHAAGHEALSLDFYPAAGRKPSAPCVVVIHGGGWDNGDRTQLAGMNHYLAQRGYAVAAISYELAPAHVWPAQADDIGAAITYLKKNATPLHIDPERFVLLGRSAGGQLATAFAYGRPDPAVRGVISLYGPQDQVFAWKYSREDDILNATKLLRQFLGGTPETAAEAYTSASAYLIATKNAPPTLLVHGANDALVWHKQSERMHAKLDELGVPNAFVSLPWATHALDFNLYGPSGQLTTYSIEWFLAAVTK
ncbi:MAG TPA: alpha/beta hydrolase [Rariglobus sp.]|nr:alpha/beta hydrolase [Rariglobus sp.]